VSFTVGTDGLISAIEESPVEVSVVVVFDLEVRSISCEDEDDGFPVPVLGRFDFICCSAESEGERERLRLDSASGMITMRRNQQNKFLQDGFWRWFGG
jgi:hypothetical protein